MTAPVILVPLDGTTHTLAALPVARALAKIYETTVLAVHVTEEPVPAPDLAHRLGLEREELRGVVVDLRSGDPAEGILSAARAQSLAAVVMCAHTGVRRPIGILGPTAERVLREAPCPVVIVRPALELATWSLKRVLLPHDGTPTTNAVIGPAIELTQRAGGCLYVLHVATPGISAEREPGSLAPPRYLDQPQHEWPAWAGEFLERLGCACPEKPMDTSQLRISLARGDPGTEIVRFAAENASDLVVLAWQAALDPDRAQAVQIVLRDAPCPVMVLRTDLGRTS